MIILYVAGALLALVLVIALPIIGTIVIEYPFIIWGKVCDNKKFFVALNALTNVSFNGIYLIFRFISEVLFSFSAARIWFLVAESLIIPPVEAVLYMQISSDSHLRIFLLTYLANIASCALGIVIFGFV